MLSIVTQNLVNMVGHLGNGDLDSNIVFDRDTGIFGVDKSAKRAVLGDHNFFQNETPTELGRANVEMRLALGNALQNIITGGGDVNPVHQQELDRILEKLFGKADAAGRFTGVEGYRPLSTREVKQLVTEAQAIRAKVALAALPEGSGLNAQADGLISRLCANASLHGKEKDVEKMVTKFQAALAKAGTKLVAAPNDAARAKITSDIRKTVSSFVRDAGKLAAKLPGPDMALFRVLDDAQKKSGTQFSAAFLARFRPNALALLKDGMTLQAFEAKVKEFLPSFLDQARDYAQPMLPRDKNAGTYLAHDLGVSSRDFAHAVTDMQKAEAVSKQAVKDGKNLTSPKQFSLGPDAFDSRIFLRGQPSPEIGPTSVSAAFVQEMDNRPNVQVTLDDGTRQQSFKKQSEGGFAGTLDGAIDKFCRGNGIQAMAVKSALTTPLDKLADGVANLAGIPLEDVGVDASGCDCRVSGDANGNVLVQISLNSKGQLASSLTLKISPQGERSVEAFTGVQTNPAFADKVEQDERRTQLAKRIDTLAAQGAAMLVTIAGSIDEKGGALGADSLATIRDAAKTTVDGLVDSLRQLAQGTGRLEKMPAEYEADFTAALNELKARCDARVDSNVKLTNDFSTTLDQIQGRLAEVSKKFTEAKCSAVADTLDSFSAQTAKFLAKLKADFFLSGEVSQDSIKEVDDAVEAFADSVGRLLDAVPAQPSLEDGVRLCAGLADAKFPELAFKTFSEDAKTKIVSSRTMVSTASVDLAAMKNAEKYAPVAELMSSFATSANRMLALADDWPVEAKQEFFHNVSSTMERLSQTVAEGMANGTDFSKGIGQVLRDEFQPLLHEFNANDMAFAAGKLAKEIDNHLQMLDDIAAGKPAGGLPSLVLSDAQRQDIAKAKEGLSAFRDQVMQLGNIPPTRSSMAAVTLALRENVAQFVDKLANPGASRRVATGGIFSFFAAKVASLVDDDAAYALSLPTARPEQNIVDSANPFASQGGVGFKSFDELRNMVRASAALGKTLNVGNPELQELAREVFTDLEEARPFLEIDEQNNVIGFRKIGGETPGEAIIQSVLSEVVSQRIAAYAAELGTAQDGVALDVGAYTGAAGMDKLRSALAEAFPAAIEQHQDVARAEARPAPEILPGEVLKRGDGVFGLDIDHLKQQGKFEAFKQVFLGLLTRDAYNLYHDGITATDDAKIREAEALLESWMHQSSPIIENKKYKTTSSIFKNSGKSLEKIGNALLKGALPLDGNVSYATVTVLRDLVNDAAALASPTGEYLSGFNTDDIGEAYQLLRRSGLTAERIDAYYAKHGNDARDLVHELALLFNINQMDANGLDALSLRLFGKPIGESDPKERGEVSRIRDIIARNVGGSVKVNDLDPMSRLAPEQKAAALFFMRTASPTTAYVDETLKIFNALKQMAAAPGAAQATVAYGGIQLNLVKSDAGVLTAEGKGWSVKTWTLQGSKVVEVEKTMDMIFPCPLDIASFINQIEDEITLNVGAYGRQQARALLPAVGDDAAQESSRARQLALNVIFSLTGTLATELSAIATRDVVAIARGMLDQAGSPKNYPAGELAKLGGDGVARFNGAATLELYKQMQKTDAADIDRMVKLPEESAVREGETLAQARVRRVHEFVAELVMPDDTTRYDLDRAAGRTDADIMRTTLLAHKYELGVVLRSLDTSSNILESFSLATGEAKDGSTPRIHELTTTLTARMYQLKALVAEAGGIDAFYRQLEIGDDPRIQDFLQGFSGDLAASSDKVLARMQGVLTEKLSAAFRRSTASVQGKQLWQKTLDEIAGSGTLDVDTGYGQLLMEALSTYFSKMEPIDRHRMASSLLRFAGDQSSLGEILGAMIKGAGPVLQKLMQGLPQTALPDDLREAVTDLKSNLPPISPEMVRASLLDMVLRSNGRIQRIELTRSLGAATVGQAFLCKVVTTDNPLGDECVIKLLRPDAQSRAARERDLFLEIAERTPGMKGVFDVRLEGIFQELDFTVEANNIKQGTVYTSGVVKDTVAGVRSMELYPSINATANTLVLRKAPGVTYDRFVAQSKAKVAGIVSSFERVRNEDGTVTYKSGDMTKVFRARRNLIIAYDEVHARQERLVGFMEKWAYEAIFGDGFFHGDVHAGNLMCDASTLTVIDYGNASRLSETDRENLKWGLAWIPARNAKNFVSYYEKLLSADGKKSLNACRDELVRNLQSLFDRSDVSDVGRVMAAAFQLIQQMDVELPGPIFNMMQSMQRLDETARLLNEQMENIRTTVESLELTADLQPGETLPAFLQPFHEMAHSEKKIDDGTDVTFKDLFQMMAKRIRVGDIPADEDVFLNIDVKGAAFITELTSYDLSERTAPSPRYQDHLEDLVKAVFDSEDPDTAKAALFGEFDQLKELATSLVNESDPFLAIAASGLLDALAQQPASMEAGDRDAWMAFASNLAIKVGQTNGTMFNICSLTMPTRMNIRVCPPYDDASAGFANAINRGGEEFAKQVGVVGGLLQGGVGLLTTFQQLAKEEEQREARAEFVDKNYGSYANAHGLFGLETATVEKTMRDFRFRPDLPKILTTAGWNTSADNRAAVVETLRFNIDNVMRDLDAAGFHQRTDRAAQDGKRTAFIELAMTKVYVAHPEWSTGLARLSDSDIDQIAAGDADIRTALAFLKRVANPPAQSSQAAQPPSSDQ